MVGIGKLLANPVNPVRSSSGRMAKAFLAYGKDCAVNIEECW